MLPEGKVIENSDEIPYQKIGLIENIAQMRWVIFKGKKRKFSSQGNIFDILVTTTSPASTTSPFTIPYKYIVAFGMTLVFVGLGVILLKPKEINE